MDKRPHFVVVIFVESDIVIHKVLAKEVIQKDSECQRRVERICPSKVVFLYDAL